MLVVTSAASTPTCVVNVDGVHTQLQSVWASHPVPHHQREREHEGGVPWTGIYRMRTVVAWFYYSSCCMIAWRLTVMSTASMSVEMHIFQ